MGRGYGYVCKKCHHQYRVMVGAGRLYPQCYREIISRIEQGEFGQQWKDLLFDTQDAAINANKVVYICNHCNRWEMGTDITLYVPKNEDLNRSKKVEGEAIDHSLSPCPMEWELRQDYKVFKRHYHVCEKCGKRMHKASEDELQNLPCPNCGESNPLEGFILWD